MHILLLVKVATNGYSESFFDSRQPLVRVKVRL